MTTNYDVIVCGARCAGAPTAMLLARRGHRVLLVDRVTFPSDTVSTHFLHNPGVEALRRWGLLELLHATGCPPIETYNHDFGPIVLSGSPGTAYAPRRTVLDKLLVDAAADAGVEVREGFTVEGLVVEDGAVGGIRGHGREGRTVTDRARLVVGADGKRSKVAAAVGASSYNERSPVEGAFYTYWSDVPVNGFELYVRPDRAMAALPTHSGQTLVLVAWPIDEWDAFRADVERNYLKTLEMVPQFSERVRAGRREERFHGTADLPGFFRQPYGPGWALVGDAGYTIDPSTAQGISNGFRDAERVAGALDDSLSGRRPYEHAMAEAHQARDAEVMPMYDLTFKLATLEPPPPDMQALLGAVAGNQRAMNAFSKMFAGVMPVPEFFAPEHVTIIMQAAGAAASA